MWSFTITIITFNKKLDFKNINFNFSKNIIMKNLNLTINKYDKIGIKGPSGSGKSTFLYILSGLIKPHSGEILADGNIVNLEIIKRNKEHLTFSFDLQIKDLKNFTNLISQIKQSNLRFKIIRHKQKKNAFIRRIFENFKRN